MNGFIQKSSTIELSFSIFIVIYEYVSNACNYQTAATISILLLFLLISQVSIHVIYYESHIMRYHILGHIIIL